MIEILILYILYNDNNTLYGIRKTVKDKFLHLNSGTFGTIHPAVARLLERQFVTEKRTISSGGRKKNIYSITQSGKKHLSETLKADFSGNMNNLEKQLGTKIVCASVLSEAEQKEFYKKVIKYYEHRILVFAKMLKNKGYNALQEGQLRIFIEGYEKEIELLKNHLF